MSKTLQPSTPTPKEVDKTIRKAMVTAGNRMIREINKELKARKWKTKNLPKWRRVQLISEGGDLVVYKELKKGSPFPFVDLGTEGPYTITAKFAPMLRFKVDPISEGDTGWRSKFSVEHPGIEAQNISGPIIEKIAVELGKLIDKELDKLDRKSFRR